jgi:hypothetical protein
VKNLGYKTTIGVLLLVIIIQGIFITTRIPKKVAKVPMPVIKGRIAIVIDDWGYNLNNLQIIGQIKYPLTVSILPDLNYSREIADQLHNRGFEIILHLPMEPHEKYRLEKNTIMASMDGQTIKRIIDEDLANVSYASGVSNHMGSAVSEDAKTMEIIFKELKKNNLFFLDSFVTSKSVCLSLSRKIGIGFTRRDVFLDNIEEPDYIKQQIYKLKTRAKNKGYAIGIGHDRKITLQALKEVMPQIEREGFKFVFLSETVK